MALDAAICLSRPERITKHFPLKEQEGIRKNLPHEHAMCRELPNAVVLFSDASYITKVHGLHLAHGHVSAARLGLGLSEPAAGGAASVCRRLSPRDERACWATSTCRSTSREVDLVVRLNAGEICTLLQDDLELPTNGDSLYKIGGQKFTGGAALNGSKSTGR